MQRDVTGRNYSRFNRSLLFSFFTAVYLFFAPLNLLAASDLCSAIFKATEATISETLPLSSKPEIKRTTRLTSEAELLRRYILESGVVDTTKLRSEFKHYLELSRTDEMIRQLEKRFGPEFSIDGKQLAGLASRDGMVKLETADLQTIPILMEQNSGVTLYEKISEAGLVAAIKNPLVYSQHRDTIRAELSKMIDITRVDSLMSEIEELHIRAVISAAGKGLTTYTDTASTAKFTYTNGGAHESLDEGVVRYRKYRYGKENLRFDGISSPGSRQKADHGSIKDAWFADRVTWLEFKMKNTNGQASRATVVNKPRFPLPDDVISILKDVSRFKSEKAFEQTRRAIKKSIKETVESLQAKGIKEATWNEAEVDAAIDFIRSLHLQGHSLEPVGRTVYMRKSYNLNLRDQEGKTQNIQITRDRHVWEVGRATGNLVQALPYVAKGVDWHFQFNSLTGMYEHLSKDKKKVLHVFHPRSPEFVYEVEGNSRRAVDVQVEPVEVVEIKVPLKFIELSDADISALPDLGAVASLRDQMIYATNDLNARRTKANLSSFAVDKGKRSSSRKDVGGGIVLLVNSKKTEFKFNPESGYWVAGAGESILVYHPTVGVLRVSGEERLKTQPVNFEHYRSDLLQ